VPIRYHEERCQVPASFANAIKSFNVGIKQNKGRNIEIKSLLVVWETFLPECSLPEKTVFVHPNKGKMSS